MKHLFYLFLAILVAGLAAWAVRTGMQSETRASRRGGPGGEAVAVETADVVSRDMMDEGQFTGSILPRAQFTVASKVGGRLRKLFVDIGDRVKNGQVIGELDDEEFAQAVSQAEAEVAIARANVHESEALLEIGKREFERVKTMRQQKVSSEVEVEAAQAQLKSRIAKHEVNKAQVLQQEAQLQANRIRMAYTKVDAAWDNSTDARHVGERFQDVGAMLSPNSPIISVIDISAVMAVVDVVERDYFKIRAGQEAEVTAAAFPGRIFNGKVARISPILNSSTRQARIEIEIPNAGFELKPGMFVSVRLVYSARNGVSTVPISALTKRLGQSGIFIVEEDGSKARFIPISTGITYRNNVEIASPSLASGKVVTLGHHLLEDGAAVLLPGAQSPSPEPGEPRGKGRKREKGG